MDQTVRGQWAKRVERWNDSGLSAKELAAEVGMNHRAFTWSRWYFTKGKRVPSENVPRRRRSNVSSAITKPVGFSAMTFVAMAAPVVAEAFEVVLLAATRIVCVLASTTTARRPGAPSVIPTSVRIFVCTGRQGVRRSSERSALKPRARPC